MMATFAVFSVVWAVLETNDYVVALREKGKVRICAELFDLGMRWHLRLIGEVNPRLAAQVCPYIAERRLSQLGQAFAELSQCISRAEARGATGDEIVQLRAYMDRVREVMSEASAQCRAARARVMDLDIAAIA